MRSASRKSCRQRGDPALIAFSGRQARAAGTLAAAFHQDDVVPDVVDVAVTFAVADFAKPALGVEGAAGLVQGKDLRLQRPVAVAFGCGNQCVEQGRSDALPLCLRCDVDADLSDAGGASGVGGR